MKIVIVGAGSMGSLLAANLAKAKEELWILENNKSKNVKITTGISDGNYTEVISNELTEGQQIITDSSNSTKKNEPAAGTPRFIR